MERSKSVDSTLRMKAPAFPPGAVRLRIVSGLDSGKEHLVLPSTVLVTFGTNPESDVQLSDPTVSRRHAEIVLDQGRFLLKDCGSTNGTFVDGVRVQEAYLEISSVIRIGRTEIQLLHADELPEFSPRSFEGMFGESTKMTQVFDLIDRVAQSSLTVLIAGETGTGKELVARAIHRRSGRAASPFIVVDCSAIPENLLESELFGHEKGAFTGASVSRKGAFELADKGTIFLDEIGDLNLPLQPKLLRVLERQEVKPLGSSRPVQVNVRVLAATNRDLKEAVVHGGFREDLFYRLSVLEISLPRLRDRLDDLPLLVDHFLRQSVAGSRKSFSPEALHECAKYDWPGNVRQLRNILERAVLNSTDDLIGPEIVGPLLPSSTRPGIPAGSIPTGSLNDLEKVAIEHALKAAHGNKTAAAKQLGIAYSTLFEKLKKYGIS